ncbi:MAG: Ig-like domain-containing protein [Reichenbachiella sp.]
MKSTKLLILSMSFLVTLNLSGATPTPPAGKKWEKIENMSDEFDGSSLNTSKWADNDPQWAGRQPARFEPGAISVTGGNLRITADVLANPGGGWTHQGGLVRSLNKATYGYYESRMKGNKTFLSSTFWLFNKRNEYTGCDVRTTELDITENVGINTGGSSWINGMITKMNSNTHSRDAACGSTPIGQQGNKADLGGNVYDAYHVYGVWWKSKNELIFYLDGNNVGTVTPPADFDLGMYLRMVVESYDWNPPKNGSDGMNDSFNNRTTYYDWTRSWRLVDDNNPQPTETVSCNSLPSSIVSSTSITVSVPYEANQTRDVVVEFWDAGWLGQGTTSVNAGSGNATITIPLTTSPPAGSNYLFKTSIRPTNGNWQTNINTCTETNVTVTITPAQSPYGGTNRTLPGTIEAEDYDLGGEGIAYHDTDTGNNGNLYRTDDVDIEARDGGFNIGWGAAGEWLEYTVNASTGTYSIEARMASTTSGKTMVVKLDGTTLGTINVPNTGDWGTFETVSIENIAITGGNDKILRLELVGGGMNLNWVKFSSGPVTIPVTGITLSSTSETLEIGQSVDLNESVVPSSATDKSVAWTTSNGAVATVSSTGLVTAVSAGTATITATTTDGGFTATSSILVNVAPDPCALPWTDTNKSITQTTLNYSSGSIDISCASTVKISMIIEGVGAMENADYLNIYYKVDGGNQVAISENTNAFASKDIEASEIIGSSVEIIINGYTSWSDETYTINNINVTADSTPPPSSNLLANSGFETGDLTSYGSWGGVSVVGNNQHAGSYAVTVNGAGAPSQVVNVSPNTTYTFSVWGKVAASGQSVNVGVKNHDATETSTQLNSTSYSRVSHTFTTGANATSVQVYFYCPNASYQAWGDDFELVEGNAAARRIDSQDVESTLRDQNSISVYPNPLESGDVKLSLLDDKDSFVRIYDIRGKLIFERNNVRNQLKIDRHEFNTTGMYFVHVQSGIINKRIKLIIR